MPRQSSRQPHAVVSVLTVLRGGPAGAGAVLSLIAVASPAGKQLTKHNRAAEPLSFGDRNYFSSFCFSLYFPPRVLKATCRHARPRPKQPGVPGNMIGAIVS